MSNNQFERECSEIMEEIISHMVADKVEIAPYGDEYIIALGTKQAISVQRSNHEHSIVKSSQGEFIIMSQRSYKKMQAVVSQKKELPQTL
jgi:hypothetical protein